MGVIIEVRNSLEGLEKKIRVQKRRMWRRAILAAATLLAAVFSTYLLLEVQTYTKVRVIQTYNMEGFDSSNYVQFSDGVLKYSRDGIAFLNRRGEEQWNQSYQIKNPFVDIYGDSGAVADRGGNAILVFDKKGLKGEVNTNFPIEQIAVAKNGIISALLKNENTPKIVCYDAKGNVLVEHQASLEGTGYPIGMAIAPEGTMLQVSYLCVEDGETATKVAYYEFGKTGDAGKDYQVTEDIYKNTVIPTSFFANDEVSVLVGTEAFMIYEGRAKPLRSQTIKLGKEIKSVFYDRKYIGFVLENADGGYELRLYDIKGRKRLSHTFTGEYSHVKVSGGNVMMYDGKKCSVFSLWGVHKFDGEVDDDILEILPLPGVNKYLMINARGLEEVRLVK